MSLPPLGLLGGTFDPVHIGHIEMARQCIETLSLQEVRFVPANMPPHKSSPLAGRRHRLAMLDLALQPYPQLTVDDVELQRGGVSYTIETLEQLRLQNPDRSVCFIIGMDAFATLTSWRRWRALTDKAHLLVIDRKGQGALSLSRQLQGFYDEHACKAVEAIHARPHGHVYKTTITIADVSSSQIRGLLKNGEAASLLPEAVANYIKENGLYV